MLDKGGARMTKPDAIQYRSPFDRKMYVIRTSAITDVSLPNDHYDKEILINGRSAVDIVFVDFLTTLEGLNNG